MIPAFACCLGLLLPFPPEGPGPGSGITRHDTLDEVIVTATRTEKKVDDVGRSVSVIGPLELMFVPMNNPARVLSSLPGVYIVGEGQNPGAV